MDGIAEHSKPKSIAPPPRPGTFDAVLLGTGVSTAVPMMGHILQGACPYGEIAVRKKDGLTVCEEAHRNPASKNRRFNVALLVRYVPPEGGRTRHIMIDAGKTMRQAVLAAFPTLGASSVDSVLLTHGHADAVMGLDDLRDLQVVERVVEDEELVGYRPAGGAGPLKIISNKDTLNVVRNVFPYLCGPPELVRPGVLRRRVAYLELEQVEDDNVTTDVAGMPVRFFPVWHGGTYVSLGFAFGPKPGAAKGGGDGYSMLYISDVKAVPPETMSWLEDIAYAGIDVLIVDALCRRSHTTHFSLTDALTFLRRIRPRRALLVGMASCELGDHDEVNEELAALRESEGLDVQLGFDGQRLPEMPTCAPPRGAAARKKVVMSTTGCAEPGPNCNC